MRLYLALCLSLLTLLPSRAETPPLDLPTAWLPTVGSGWFSLDAPGSDYVGLGIGIRPIQPLKVEVRQGYWGAETDIALELLSADRFRPSLVLDSRGHGGPYIQRQDSLLLGGRLGVAEASGGVAVDGVGRLRPVFNLRVPALLPNLRQAWLTAATGTIDGTVIEAGWAQSKAGTFSTLGWRKRQGITGRVVFQFAGEGNDEPWYRPPRDADGGLFTDIGLWQSPGAAFRRAITGEGEPPRRVIISSHRLGLPGVAATLYGTDISALKRNRTSAAEMRQHTHFQRAETPDHLSHHWEVQIDLRLETEPPPRGYGWMGRASAGMLAHLVPFAGLIITGEGRLAASTDIWEPKWAPPAAGRSDAALYLTRPYSVDRVQAAIVRALSPSLDLQLEAGHMDPLYGGGGVELRYQPVRARWSIGGTVHHVWKRPPTTMTVYRGTGRTTGFVNAGLEGQDGETRQELATGRYLAGDWGATYSLSQRYGTGLELALDATATTRTSRLGLSLSMPLFGVGQHVEASASLRIRPLAREYAERLDRAVTLSDLRFAAGYGRVTSGWERGFSLGR